jgi:hypothetical protein
VHDEMKRRCVATQPCNTEGLTPLDTAVGNTADYFGWEENHKENCMCVCEIFGEKQFQCGRCHRKVSMYGTK